MKRQSQTARASDHRGQAGFTIIELAVGTVVFAIIMGAVYALLEVGRSDRFTTMQKTETIQNVRIALNTVGRDAINAGVGYPNEGALLPDDRIQALLNTSADSDNDPDALTPVVAGNGPNQVNGTPTDQVTFMFIDDTFNNGESLPIGQILGSGAQLQITGTKPNGQPYNNSPCRIGDLYLVTGQNGSGVGMVTGTSGQDKIDLANGDPLGINLPGNTSPLKNIQTPATVSKINWVTYYVVDEDGNGPDAGTLMRRVWGGTGGQVNNPLAFGIENLQIQYVLADGTVTDNPVSGPDRIAGNADDSAIYLQNVRQVIVNVAVRSPETDRRTNQPLRSTLTSSFSTRNLVYEKQ